MRFPLGHRGLVLLGVGAAVLVLALPVRTRQAVDFQVVSRPIPLALKAFEFIDRDYHYRQLAHEIVSGAATEPERAARLFDWTRAHIRAVPAGWAVVDDHIWHIIIRGYGADDQQADVFTTLAAYAGLEAFWKTVRLNASDPGRVLSFVKIGGRWVAFDVAHGRAARDARGNFIGLQDIRTGALAEWSPEDAKYLTRLASEPLLEPVPLRARLQMPLRRLMVECARFFSGGK